MKDAAIKACALMIKGICLTTPKDDWTTLIEARIRYMLKQDAASPQPAQTRALTEAVEVTIETIRRQLDLISERALGSYLDKTPIVRSLQAHKKRLESALLATGGDRDL